MTQTIDRYAILAFLPFVVLAPGLGFVLSRRFARPWLLVSLAIASIGAVLAVTVGGRMLKLSSWGVGDFVLGWLVDGASWSHVLEPDRTWILNAALFLPAGCFVTLTTRRPWQTLVSLCAFSFVIEMVQRATRLGVADVSDLVANIVGAGAGTLIAAAILRNARTGRVVGEPSLRGADDAAPA